MFRGFFRGNVALPTIFEDSLSIYEVTNKLILMVKEAIGKSDETLERANKAVEKAEEIIASGGSVEYESATEKIVFSGFGGDESQSTGDVQKLDIDGISHNIKDASAQQRCGALETRMYNAENNIGLVDSRVNGAVQRIGTLEGKMTDAENDIDNLEQSLSDSVDDLQSQLNAEEDAIDDINDTIASLEQDIASTDAGLRFRKVRIYFADTSGKAAAASKIKSMLKLSDANCEKIPCSNCTIGVNAGDTTFASVILSEGGSGGTYVADPYVTDLIILCGYPDTDDESGIATGATNLFSARDNVYPNAFIHCVGVDWSRNNDNRERLLSVYNHFKNNLNGPKCVYFNEYRVLANSSYLEANDQFSAAAGEYVGRYVANSLLGGRGCEYVYSSIRDTDNANIYLREYDREGFMLLHNYQKYEKASGSIIGPDMWIPFTVLNNPYMPGGAPRQILTTTSICIEFEDTTVFRGRAIISVEKIGNEVTLQLYIDSKLTGLTATKIGSANVYVSSFTSVLPMRCL